MLGPNLVAGVGIAPTQLPHRRLGVRVKQQFVGIEAVALLGPVGSVCPVAIQKTRFRPWQIAVPYPVGLFPHLDTICFASTARIEEA